MTFVARGSPTAIVRVRALPWILETQQYDVLNIDGTTMRSVQILRKHIVDGFERIVP